MNEQPKITRQILGDSSEVRDMLKLIHRVAATKTNVLVIGESGTGKELVARMIHEAGPLRGAPFVPVNCGAIPETLIESEMFGHKKGSFTGAVSEKAGLFEAANGGTLFLDEVGELPLSMQVKLLRAIQERCFRKVGGNDDIRVDVRIIAATNRNLEEGVAKGTFREDLYYRLNVIQLKTPPLRSRRGDVRLLAGHFLKAFAQKQKKDVVDFEPDAWAALEGYAWPGNVRELENVVERAVTLGSGGLIPLAALPPQIVDAAARAGTRAVAPAGATVVAPAAAPEELRLPAPDFSRGPIDLDRILGDVERTYLLQALEHSGGVKKKAAELLGITFRSIRYRLKKLGVESGPDGDGDEE
jgi:two-component system response regulator PilR (NtrC family)